MFAKQSIYHSTHSCTGTCLFIPLISRFLRLNIHLLTVCSVFPERFIFGQLTGHCITLHIHPQQPRSTQAFVNYLSISSNPFYFGVSSSFSAFNFSLLSLDVEPRRDSPCVILPFLYPFFFHLQTCALSYLQGFCYRVSSTNRW
jgi:hypothetical protein